MMSGVTVSLVQQNHGRKGDFAKSVGSDLRVMRDVDESVEFLMHGFDLMKDLSPSGFILKGR